ncbi:MAG: hypothetical protein Q9163_005692 [Psora crenata]
MRMHLSYLSAVLGLGGTVIAQGSYGGAQTSCSSSQVWVYQGCYSTANAGRHANFNWQLSSDPNSEKYYPGFTGAGSLTVELCQTACRGHGFKWSALFYGTECYCSEIFPNPNPPANTNSGIGTEPGPVPPPKSADSNCNAQCQGNPAETCGGGDYAQVYFDSSFTNSTSVQGYQSFKYLGCYSNVSPGPTFAQISTTSSISCANYCGQLGYSIMSRSGVDSNTGATSCGCGTEIQRGLQISESFCNSNCDGTVGAGGYNSCGGNNAFSVFENTYLEGCYVPRKPGVDASHTYVAPDNAGVFIGGGTGGASPSSSPSSSISSSSASFPSALGISSTTSFAGSVGFATTIFVTQATTYTTSGK